MLIDSHFHIPQKQYKQTVADLVADTVSSGVSHMLAIGTSVQNNELMLKTIAPHKNIFAAIGIYPHEDAALPLDDLYKALSAQYNAHKDKIVAVGECGIDLNAHQNERTLEQQLELFKMQIGFALEHDLPLIIHNRNGDEHILDVLSHYKDTPLKGVVHCFASDWSFAQKILDLGFYISFTAIVTYPSAGEPLLEVVQKVPSNKYLVETDAPYLPPQPYRGQTNYPKYVKITAEKIAEVRKTSFSQVEKETFQNTCKLFNLKI